ncbi:MAG: hypothetical protein FD130_664, partial [Halothiobacillaceae bacterium]
MFFVVNFSLFTLVLAAFSSSVYATGLFGAPATNTKEQKFSLGIGSGMADNTKIRLEKTSLNGNIGSNAFSKSVSSTTGEIGEEAMFVDIAYGVNSGTSLYGRLSTGKQKQIDDVKSDSLSSYTAGIRFAPSQSGRVKIGAVLQAHYADSSYTIDDYRITNITINDRVYYSNVAISGEEQISYTRLDALLAISMDIAS